MTGSDAVKRLGNCRLVGTPHLDFSSSPLAQWINGFIFGPPAWVWPLLVVLIFLGRMARHQREVSVWPFLFIPLIGLVSVQSILSLSHSTFAWTSFAFGYVCAAIFFYFRQKKWIVERSGMRIVLAGESVSMATFMIIFWSNFVRGTMQQIAPDVYSSLVFVLVFSFLIGGAAGTFLGRSVRIVIR